MNLQQKDALPLQTSPNILMSVLQEWAKWKKTRLKTGFNYEKYSNPRPTSEGIQIAKLDAEWIIIIFIPELQKT